MHDSLDNSMSVSQCRIRLYRYWYVPFELATLLTLFGWVFQEMRAGDWLGEPHRYYVSDVIRNAASMVGVPICFMLLFRRRPGSVGLTTIHLSQQLRIAWRGLVSMALVSPAFAVVGMLGFRYARDWSAALILLVAFLIALWWLIRRCMSLPTVHGAICSRKIMAIAIIVFIACGFLIWLVRPVADRVGDAILVVVFVGFAEEFLFRGYIQSVMNRICGRPFRTTGVHWGHGLWITSILFGLCHVILNGQSGLWPWGVWTAGAGLVFGYLREKSGGILAPATAHGGLLLIGELFR